MPKVKALNLGNNYISNGSALRKGYWPQLAILNLGMVFGSFRRESYFGNGLCYQNELCQ